MIKFALSNGYKKSECLVLPVWENAAVETGNFKLDTSTKKSIQQILSTKDFEGKKLQIAFLYPEKSEIKRVMLVGLGKKELGTIRSYKQVVGAAIIALQQKKNTHVLIQLSHDLIELFGVEKIARETVVAAELANYVYEHHKEKNAKTQPVQNITFVVDFNKEQKKMFEQGLRDGAIIADATNTVRTLGNTPPSMMTPTVLAQEAVNFGKQHKQVQVKILSRPQMKKLGMGCLLGVAQGSVQEPKFIVIEYMNHGDEPPTVLVGKGITYDSGGLSIKPADAMIDMKFDMLGAATVFGIINAVARLGLKKNLVALMPCCENMPSGTAYRPDDILTAMNGKTVLIENTDAEGRLILADALCYAATYKPKEVLDWATLTGWCVLALGNERSGVFSTDDELVHKLLDSSEMVGEQFWRLPIGEEFSEAVKSEIADLKNTGGVGHPRYGGASTAAAFLQHFTSYPWLHIDMSCSYYGGKGKPWIRWGANGFGVQTMVEYLQQGE